MHRLVSPSCSVLLQNVKVGNKCAGVVSLMFMSSRLDILDVTICRENQSKAPSVNFAAWQIVYLEHSEYRRAAENWIIPQ